MSWIALGLIAVVVWGLFVFNRLIQLRNRAAGSWADIDVQLKRRHDLVGNLVEAVKGYAHHERQVLEKVSAARSGAEGARSRGRPGSAGVAEAQLSGEMVKLFALVEAYPDLKASERFGDLQLSLTRVENDLQNARRYYNAIVRDLNTRIESIPDLFVARLLGFRPREFFSLEDRAEAASPRVELGT
ncbi:MAG TPA: LemA family protein [Vicinamibacteria bacterium]|nr:LemA family protein [Vicinamibacteria bacterium]